MHSYDVLENKLTPKSRIQMLCGMININQDTISDIKKAKYLTGTS